MDKTDVRKLIRSFIKVKIDHIYLTSFGKLGLSVSHRRLASCSYRNLELAEIQRLVWMLWTYAVQRDKENAMSVNGAASEQGLGIIATKLGNKATL